MIHRSPRAKRSPWHAVPSCRQFGVSVRVCTKAAREDRARAMLINAAVVFSKVTYR